jgi:hypothetical protein
VHSWTHDPDVAKVDKEPAAAEVQFSRFATKKSNFYSCDPLVTKGFLAKNVLKALKPPPFSVLNPMP